MKKARNSGLFGQSKSAETFYQSFGAFMVGLTGPHSNYKILYRNVKQIKLSAPVESASNSELVDLSYDPHSIVKSIKQQQKHHFSNKEIEEIVKKYQSGVSTYDLAEQYNCHRNTITSQLKKQGIKVTIEKIDMDDAVRMYESGSSTKEIAAKYHMSSNTVSQRLRQAGVKMRTRWDYSRK